MSDHDDAGEFAGVPIPQALRAHFQIEFTPSSLIAYDPACFSLPEVQAALVTIRSWAVDDAPGMEWRKEWAAAEWERWPAAAVGQKKQPRPVAPLRFDAELGRLYAQIKEHLDELGPGALVSVSEPVMVSGVYRDAALLVEEPGRPYRLIFLGDVTTLRKDDEFRFDRPARLKAGDTATPYALVAQLRGISQSNAETRISRDRKRRGKPLARSRGRGTHRVDRPLR